MLGVHMIYFSKLTQPSRFDRLQFVQSSLSRIQCAIEDVLVNTPYVDVCLQQLVPSDRNLRVLCWIRLFNFVSTHLGRVDFHYRCLDLGLHFFRCI